MNEERLDRMESRLAALEAEMERLSRQDRLKTVSEANATAPPVVQPPPPRFDVPGPPTAPPPSVSVTPSLPNPDMEYQFGAKWLPRIGAALMVLGIAFLIGLGVNSGWITPKMLFTGAVLLCGTFIAIGLRLRDEHEDFGQVLSGIGSCGLFATFAGGHIYQNLYNGETMVLAFVLWSLANLGFAMWKKSLSFLSIGVIGGFLGSAMPLARDAFETSLGLHAMILVVSAAIIVAHRFGTVAVGLWIASMVSLLPAVIPTHLPWIERVVAVDLATLICVAAYLLGRPKPDAVTDRLVIGGLIWLGGILSFGLRWGMDGSWHTVGLSLATALLACSFWRDTVVRNALLWTAASLAFLLAPLGLDRLDAAFLYAGLALVLGVVGRIVKKDEPVTMASVSLPLSVVMYFTRFVFSSLPPARSETIYLALLTLACVSIAIGLGKRENDLRLALSFLIAWPAITRLGTILFALPSDFKLASFSATIAWVVFGVALLATGFIVNLRNYRYAALTVLIAAVGKVLMLDMATATPELRVAVLIGVGLALVGGGYAYVRKKTMST
jgi:hypothetical protein